MTIDRYAIEDIAHRLKGWSEAYPEDIFRPLSEAEIKEVTKVYPGVIDRASAAMGRHFAKQMREMGVALEKALGPEEG